MNDNVQEITCPKCASSNHTTTDDAAGDLYDGMTDEPCGFYRQANFLCRDCGHDWLEREEYGCEDDES